MHLKSKACENFRMTRKTKEIYIYKKITFIDVSQIEVDNIIKVSFIHLVNV